MSVRLDAAPNNSLRSAAARSRPAIGGVELSPAADPTTPEGTGDRSESTAASPLPSIDGKGTRINTYA
jgi:hypothetical protein